MRLISEAVKADNVLTSVNLNGASTTHKYYSMKGRHRALFVTTHGAMAAAATAICQVMQAQDASGTGAKVVTNNAVTVTANNKVSKLTLTCATVLAGQAVVINGLTFTGGGSQVLATRTFDRSSGDNAAATSLAACINDATYGAPGLTASSTGASGVVTIVATEPGDTIITIGTVSATITPATVDAVSFVECDAAFLDIANAFNHVSLLVTTSTAQQTSVVLLREGAYSPVNICPNKADVA